MVADAQPQAERVVTTFMQKLNPHNVTVWYGRNLSTLPVGKINAERETRWSLRERGDKKGEDNQSANDMS
jgi:hypothetical protein